MTGTVEDFAMNVLRGIAIVISALALGSGVADAEARTYFPRYAEPHGGMVEFFKDGFYVHPPGDEDDGVYICKRLESMTKAIHWGQCEGGEKFLFTLDPEHPETMKIGDVVYKECGKHWDKC